jgi:tripartite-type tricarboxylate transporter receptor subunit TctC
MSVEIRILMVVLFGLATLNPAVSTEAQDFYQGKTIRLVVGYAPGGGYDFYARLVARYMGKHIPGNPAFVVENMPGAGSLASANYLYKLAKADGLTVGHFNGSLFPLQAMGQKEIAFDGAKFLFVGSVAKVEIVCGFPKAGGIDSPEKWLSAKPPPRLGGTAPGTGGHDTTRLLHATIGVPIQMVLGYKSTGDMRLAMERGELNGLCTGWESFKSLWRSQIESGEFVIVLQVLPKAHPDLPKVPLAISYARTDEARQLLKAGAHDIAAISRPFVLPPNTPKERVQILQKAFTATMNDPGLLGDAAKANLDIGPLPGEELERTIHGLLRTPPALLAKLKQIISPQ